MHFFGPIHNLHWNGIRSSDLPAWIARTKASSSYRAILREFTKLGIILHIRGRDGKPTKVIRSWKSLLRAWRTHVCPVYGPGLISPPSIRRRTTLIGPSAPTIISPYIRIPESNVTYGVSKLTSITSAPNCI